MTDATVQAVGSQAQGFTGNPKKPAGKPFQPGKSDADFAISSVQLLRMAKQSGVPINPKVVLDRKYYVLKNQTPEGTGFYQMVGKRFAALAAKWNERVYGDPNVDGFDFKMNVAVEPFEKAINVAKPRKDKK